MRIFRELSEVVRDDNNIVTLGTFDGIHLGHKKIINEVVKKATDYGDESFLITFHPHPRKIISRGYNIKLLNTSTEKLEMFKSLGIQNLLIINFTKEFSKLSPEAFIDNYIVNGIGAKEVVIGYDHHFGKGRGGDIGFLKNKGIKSGFKVTIIPGFQIENTIVSSSKIRDALLAGNIVTVSKYLGRFYSFSGIVVQGDKRGRELGFPTANLRIENEDKLLPAIGIYAVEFIVKGNIYQGLLSIGKRPTFYDSGEIVPEVYVFDFNFFFFFSLRNCFFFFCFSRLTFF